MEELILPIRPELDARFHRRDPEQLAHMADKGFIITICKVCEHHCFWKDGDDRCCYCRKILPRPHLPINGKKVINL